MVGLPSKSGGDADMPAFTLRARTGCEQSQQEHPLFDHLVGEREQIVGDFDAKRLGRPEIDYQLELGGLCNRQFGGHCPRPLGRILPTIERPILDVIKFVAPGRRKIAPPPQRPLWRQSLCGLETRALALQRD
jgi:hypothetical protein